MKTNLAVLLLAVSLQFGCRTAGTTAETKPAGRPGGAIVGEANDPAPITEATATLSVSGMSCPLCANNIDKQLMRVKGVSGVSVDLGSGKVVVKIGGDQKPSRMELADAIRQSGFTLTRIETP